MSEIESLGEALGAKALIEDVGVAPIDVVDVGTTVPEAAAELGKLLLAEPAKDLIKTGTVPSLYSAAQKLDRPSADADERNNLGCAWALLAYSEPRADYWPRALAALDASKDSAKTDAQRQRAEGNRMHVAIARSAGGQ